MWNDSPQWTCYLSTGGPGWPRNDKGSSEVEMASCAQDLTRLRFFGDTKTRSWMIREPIKHCPQGQGDACTEVRDSCPSEPQHQPHTGYPCCLMLSTVLNRAYQRYYVCTKVSLEPLTVRSKLNTPQGDSFIHTLYYSSSELKCCLTTPHMGTLLG